MSTRTLTKKCYLFPRTPFSFYTRSDESECYKNTLVPFTCRCGESQIWAASRVLRDGNLPAASIQRSKRPSGSGLGWDLKSPWTVKHESWCKIDGRVVDPKRGKFSANGADGESHVSVLVYLLVIWFSKTPRSSRFHGGIRFTLSWSFLSATT